MAEDREQKIRDVYEAMHREHLKDFSHPTPQTIVRMQRQARAAVDVLAPVKRIELSGGFHAEPIDDSTSFMRFYKEGGDYGMLPRDIVEAWEKASTAAAERHKLASDHNALAMKLENAIEENENLKQRIASLGRIIEGLHSSAALDTMRGPTR